MYDALIGKDDSTFLWRRYKGFEAQYTLHNPTMFGFIACKFEQRITWLCEMPVNIDKPLFLISLKKELPKTTTPIIFALSTDLFFSRRFN
jgi:hypothetical protein